MPCSAALCLAKSAIRSSHSFRLRGCLCPKALILIIPAPDRPSRPNTMSMSSMRRKVCARRSRPGSTRGVFLPLRRNRSDALTAPAGPFAHDRANASGERVCLDDALYRRPAVFTELSASTDPPPARKRIAFCTACDDDHTKCDLAGMLRTSWLPAEKHDDGTPMVGAACRRRRSWKKRRG
jgi:hypothetical protein